MIAKVLASAAIVLGAAVGVAVPAMADPSPNPGNPADAIGPLSPICADTGCLPGSVPAVDPQQITLEFKSDLSGLNDFADEQGQQ